MSKTRTFTCQTHGTLVEAGPDSTGCPDCNIFLDNPPDPSAMTGGERAAELERWGGIMTVPFVRVHERTEALVGRPVWTHEMADWSALVEEARTWDHPENPFAHAVETLSDRMGAENVYVYPEAPQHD